MLDPAASPVGLTLPERSGGRGGCLRVLEIKRRRRPVDRPSVRTYKEGIAARCPGFTRERGWRGGVAAQSLISYRRRRRVRGVLARWCLGERSVLLHRVWEPRNRSPSTPALHGVRRAALGEGRVESFRAVWYAAL